MFLSLPHSLLALVICLLEPKALGQSASSSRKTHFGDYVASGLGVSSKKPTSTSKSSATTQSAATLPALTTGTGQEYASSCASALATWSSSSFDWQWSNADITTTTFSSGFTEVLDLPGTTKVTSLLTLCDGHPRVVGYTSVSTPGMSTSTVAWTNTITETEPNFAYPTPPPCSIQPSDCKTLSSSYNVWLSSQLQKYGMATGAGPLCTVTPSSSISYSSNSRGQTCDNCLIAASTARVMFWPVTTASGGNLCNNTASTITATPTGPPNSFVTEGITITSPTVAVSLGFMSRVDGCGTTINHTIIPVHPDQVSSVRGYRALFSHHRFNFADLNYWCGDTNTTNATIAEGQGDSCYQQVPAAAYFGGLNNAVVYAQAPFRNLSKADMTIWDDYQPQLLPPQTMTEAIASLWGPNCYIHPDGVWDPPIALTPEASLIVPTFPSTESGGPESTPASPLNSYGAQPPRQTGINVPIPPSDGSTSQKQHFTALPETGGYGGDGGSGSGGDGSSSGQNGGSSGGGGDGNNSGGSGGGNSQGGQGSSGGSGNNGGSQGGSGSGNNGGSQGGNGGSDGNSGSGNNGGSNENSGSGSNGESNGNSGSGNNGGSNGNSGSGSNGGSSGDSGSGSNGGSDNGSGQSNPGGVTQVNVHTTIMTIGNKIVQCTQDSNGAWIIPDITTTYTASAGGSAVEFEGATLTAGPNGFVNVDALNTVLTIGNRVMTGSKNANGAWVIPDSSTTHTVSQGGSVVMVDGVAVTAASQGLVKAGASETSDSDGSDGSSKGSGTGTQDSSATQTDEPQQSTSATGSDGAAAASNTDSSSSGAGATRWSPAVFAWALLSMYICAL